MHWKLAIIRQVGAAVKNFKKRVVVCGRNLNDRAASAASGRCVRVGLRGAVLAMTLAAMSLAAMSLAASGRGGARGPAREPRRMLFARGQLEVATCRHFTGTSHLNVKSSLPLALRDDPRAPCRMSVKWLHADTDLLRGVLAITPKSSHASVKWDICDYRKTEVSPQGTPSSTGTVSGGGVWAIGATPWCIWKTVAQSVSVSGRGQQKRLPGDLCRAWCSPGSSALGRRRS